jgi:hypothetical protein
LPRQRGPLFAAAMEFKECGPLPLPIQARQSLFCCRRARAVGRSKGERHAPGTESACARSNAAIFFLNRRTDHERRK